MWVGGERSQAGWTRSHCPLLGPPSRIQHWGGIKGSSIAYPWAEAELGLGAPPPTTPPPAPAPAHLLSLH